MEDGYGKDAHSIKAKELIQSKIGIPDADIYFVSGGTQANLTSISAMLQTHESVICATSGHINFEEAGAIEATGHKILTIDCPDGKITAEKIAYLLRVHSNVPHFLKPKMVYLSNSTEVGTIYSKQELESISTFCRENGLYLYLDGARLASALTTENGGLTLADVARLTDVFYIGGTKIGALLGEAIVVTNEEIKKDFIYHIKQRGALLAKGRLLGIQFYELLKDDLYFTLGKHINVMAQDLTNGLKKLGIAFYTESVTNQIFPILDNSIAEKLREKYDFYTWTSVNEQQSAIRLVTSWSTTPAEVEIFIADIAALLA